MWPPRFPIQTSPRAGLVAGNAAHRPTSLPPACSEFECTEPYPPGVADEWVSPGTRVGACAFALTVRGDSMEPGFTEGDVPIVDPDLEARSGDFVIVRLDDAQEATFEQLVIDGAQRFLKPLNARYPAVEINGNATIVGMVVEKRQVF